MSPTPIGIEDRKIVQLRTTFLAGLPFADQMDPATSLYELGGMVFPGKAIMLREHFRCAEPIIRFSNQFYPKPLIPLRIPKASERLDPPLIDMYVPHGRKIRDVNQAEVDAIVDEIAKLTSDPALENRTIGVISLIGPAQAKIIYDRLVSDLGAEVVEKHPHHVRQFGHVRNGTSYSCRWWPRNGHGTDLADVRAKLQCRCLPRA